ncbi:unnamed protein product, partial [Clonostachys rosea f. rosea IK726]
MSTIVVIFVIFVSSDSIAKINVIGWRGLIIHMGLSISEGLVIPLVFVVFVDSIVLMSLIVIVTLVMEIPKEIPIIRLGYGIWVH